MWVVHQWLVHERPSSATTGGRLPGGGKTDRRMSASTISTTMPAGRVGWQACAAVSIRANVSALMGSWNWIA
jgi:hypothetical protein